MFYLYAKPSFFLSLMCCCVVETRCEKVAPAFHPQPSLVDYLTLD